MLFAIVDIETTGSYAAGSGITEIAIVIHDGRAVLHAWQSLINPYRPIPRFIQQLTGITPELVAGAPSFEEVAEHIHGLLQDKIFVAHNVNFDYSFVKHHLERCGHKLDERRLCTVRLARKLAPGLRSYSLGKLCADLEIPHTDHHRAYGDAHATALLLAHLTARDADGAVLKEMLKGRNKEQYLPPNVPVEQVEDLPQTPGVYYFYNAAGKVIYVGKALNLYKRVKSHFANNKAGKQKADFVRDMHRISYQPVATDLMAHIFESVEIRRLWPVHNRSQRGYQPKFGLYAYEDQQGFQRLALDNNKQHYKPLHTFNTLVEGREWLHRLVTEFSLCPRLCNVAKVADCTNGIMGEGCTGACTAAEGAEKYNTNVAEAMDWIGKSLPTLALLDTGRDDTERSCILVVKGVFTAMGYVGDEADLHDVKALQQRLDPYPDNDYIRSLIYRHAAEHPDKCVRWEGSKMIHAGNIIRSDADEEVYSL